MTEDLNTNLNVNNNDNQNSNGVSGKLKFSIGVKQSKFIFNVSLIAGIGFLIVLGLSYFWKYLIVSLQNEWILRNFQYLMIGAMVACLVISMVYNFSRQRSMPLLIFMCIAFILFFSFGISSIFIFFDMSELFFVFAITGGTLLINGIIGFFMSDKFAMSLTKIMMVIFSIYILGFLAYLLISLFTNANFAWYSYLIFGLMGVIILISNCLQFYRLKKINNFINMSEISKSEVTKLTIETSLSLLMSVIQTLMLVARLYLWTRH